MRKWAGIESTNKFIRCFLLTQTQVYFQFILKRIQYCSNLRQFFLEKLIIYIKIKDV